MLFVYILFGFGLDLSILLECEKKKDNILIIECDGIDDCKDGSDELRCKKLFLFPNDKHTYKFNCNDRRRHSKNTISIIENNAVKASFKNGNHNFESLNIQINNEKILLTIPSTGYSSEYIVRCDDRNSQMLFVLQYDKALITKVITIGTDSTLLIDMICNLPDVINPFGIKKFNWNSYEFSENSDGTRVTICYKSNDLSVIYEIKKEVERSFKVNGNEITNLYGYCQADKLEIYVYFDEFNFINCEDTQINYYDQEIFQKCTESYTFNKENGAMTLKNDVLYSLLCNHVDYKLERIILECSVGKVKCINSCMEPKKIIYEEICLETANSVDDIIDVPMNVGDLIEMDCSDFGENVQLKEGLYLHDDLSQVDYLSEKSPMKYSYKFVENRAFTCIGSTKSRKFIITKHVCNNSG